MTVTHDAVVIGAGLSGLVAARELVREGLDTIVLEARSRPGGRTHTTDAGGVTVDLGGEWVDEAHAEMKDLVAELGLGLVPAARRKEEALWSVKGRVTNEMPLSVSDAAAYRRMQEALRETASGVDPEAPWKGAPVRDASIEGWLRAEGMSEDGLHAVETLLSTCGSTVPLTQMSFYLYAVKVATRGGPGKGNEYRVEGGSGRVAEKLAEDLGARVRYSSPVVEVRQGRGVEVRYEDGEGIGTVRARRAVLAIPLTLHGGIRFDPPLPPALGRLASGGRYGAARKMAFVYDVGPVEAPSLAVTDTPLGYLWTVRGAGGETGIVSFAGGRPLEAELRFPGEERKRRAVGLLQDLFGLSEPGVLVEEAWSEDPWARGSYLIGGPGDSELLRGIGRPFGLLHLAGAESVAAAPSFMNSAVKGGLRAAREVAGALSGAGHAARGTGAPML
ncbi:MAG: hypothetical protein AVDCRST_MAG25-1454 [uncultured Rubrobacteraceae bacterium]|uniref:Amine oxidase domain-containing protein n=1 Tax=uncultured Rubrobacteraceae bacterium TaxID=349277 RepID=A0A6J4REF3_9ACTN|nr:MAG: hypothetical protein AVDCRST_MAG25-1454 [uncultured Rubrobacteraceae bacterium]